MMSHKGFRYAINDKVIVNTGGKDIEAVIHNDPPNKKGHYWKEQDCYRCRFKNGTSQYIEAKHIRLKD